jgi:outer membrane autotransporter protein
VTARGIAGAIIPLLLLALLTSRASAQCSNTAPATGTTVTCAGASTTPVVAAAGSTGVTINVLSGASVSAAHAPAVPFPLLSVQSSSSITNSGTLSLTGGAGSGTNRGAAMLGTVNGNTLTNNGSIGTSGGFNDGMAANGSGNTLINNGTITTAGPNAYGMTAAWGQTNTGELNNTLINTGSVTTSGSNARAASILGGSGTINNSGTLATMGSSSNGAYLQGNNDQLINSGKIIVSGATSDAVFSNTVGSNFTATIQNLAGGQIISANGVAIRTLNGATTIVNAGLLQGGGGTAISGGTGNVSLILQTGSTIVGTANGGAGTNTVTLQGSGSAANPFVNFQTLVMQGAAWNFTGTGTFATAQLQSGTFNLTGALGTATNVGVGAGATLNMAGVSQTFGTVTNAGTIMTGGAPGTTLTASKYVGSSGNLVLNTYLGADNSASDQLLINGGTATGTTTLTIHNVGGPGDATTANGILVVNTINGGTTASGAFALAPGELRGGAYDYRLFQGGLGGADPNDWFLRSTFNGPGPGVAIGASPPPSVLPAGSSFPIIGPELATDGVVQPMARQMGLEMLGTLHERIGDTLTLANTGGDGSGVVRSDWARFFGQGINNSYQAFADPRASGWTGGFQGGVDLWRGSLLPGHRDAAGVYLGFANSTLTVDGLVTNAAATAYVQSRTGTVALTGYSAGGYWTHYGPGGWYVDAVLQGTYYNGNALTQYADLPVSGSGFISSLEGGYPVPLPLGPRFVLEPQAQIIWQQVAFGQGNDGVGSVALGSTSGPTGRLGVRGLWTIDGDNGSAWQPQVWQPYVRANLWRDWGADAITTFGTAPVPLIEAATRLEFAAGVTAKLGQGVSLYAQAGYQFALDNTYLRNGIQGDIGLRYVW